MKQISINNNIVFNPLICHGKPTFKGTRVMVWQVLEMLADGEGVKEVLSAFPPLSVEDIKAALNYAVSLTKGSYALINAQSKIFA